MTETLYRLTDEGGALLYVGISNAAPRRLNQHLQTKPWYDKVATITFEHFLTRQEVECREREVVRLESPEYNTVYNLPERVIVASNPMSMRIGDVEVLTLQEAARRLEMNSTTLTRQAQRGVLLAVRFGREWAVTADEVERYRREHKGKRGQASPRYRRKPKEHTDA